jgi:hypothetical protein
MPSMWVVSRVIWNAPETKCMKHHACTLMNVTFSRNDEGKFMKIQSEKFVWMFPAGQYALRSNTSINPPWWSYWTWRLSWGASLLMLQLSVKSPVPEASASDCCSGYRRVANIPVTGEPFFVVWEMGFIRTPAHNFVDGSFLNCG